jgi:hypothetical protein
MMNKINAKPFLFLSVQKTRLARAARNGRSPTSADVGGYFELWRWNLRGRQPSARIVDCARTKTRPCAIGDLV